MVIVEGSLGFWSIDLGNGGYEVVLVENFLPSEDACFSFLNLPTLDCDSVH